MSSSSIEYLSAHLNKSSIVVRGFLARDTKKGVLGQILLLKICRMTSMLKDSIWSTTCLNCFTNSLSDSFSCIFMFYRILMFLLCLAEHRYCPIKAFNKSQKLFTEFVGRRWNHGRA